MGSTHRHTQTTSTRRRGHRAGRTATAAAIVALGLSACGSDFASDESADTATEELAADEFSASEDGDDFAIGGGEAEAPAERADEATAPATVGGPATAGGPATGAPVGDFGRDLIVDAGVTMLTPDVGTAVDDVVDIATRNGGAVYNADVTIDDPLEDGSVPGRGTIVIRIPPTQLDGLIDDLRGVGQLRNQTQSVDDVTEQLVDLDIQIRQAFESVERMEAILAETTDFDGLVAAETELVRRQTAYERLLAAQRNIDDRVALSKLTVTVQYQAPGTEPVPVVEEGDPGIADAFSDGWNAFVSVLFGIAFVLAVIAPFAAVAVFVGGITWLVTRRVRHRRAAIIEAERNRHEPLDPPTATPDVVNDPSEELVDANQTD